ncbi:capsule assembly Wzi family protein [Spirosoma oryzicola]|uniref:capsule assembly Wzi family protein n=1 Tax=Spirosoma oryzicola TaxID=2898794 RepID=UPI001E2AB5D9|nr:capsule assembly Wzi family protein [Spirosoma oryzicola]UHG89064.1 capsule assembly Wzi family protein [Spirosoma oryzicola]
MRLLVLYLLTVSTCFCQTPKPLRYSTEVGSYFSTSGQTPFWLRTNQFGIVSLDHSPLTVRQALHVDYHDAPRTKRDSLQALNRRVDWGWRAEAVLNTGYNVRLIIPEAYVKVRVGPVEVWSGRRREIIGLVDTTLTSGSYTLSGNALPMLKFQLAIREFWPRKGLLAIKGLYSHGWFEADRFVRNTWLHEKALYVRLGKPNWRLKLYGGMNHEVMWGGTTTELSSSRIKNNLLPSTFRDYIDVVTASSLGARTNVDTNRVSQFDRENRIGNHLGTVDLGFEYTGRSFAIFAYRQSIYEDGSLFHLTNLRDGLHGIRIRRLHSVKPRGLQIETVLLEYLYTQNQGGSLFIDNQEAQRGRDNYFNHSQYQDGWSRYGMTLGTPFITPSGNSRSDLPRYGFTNNNRVAVLHLGLSGHIADFVRFQLKASYSENLGTYEVPFPEPVHQFSGLLDVSTRLPVFNGLTVNTAIATDIGRLYPASVGYYLSVRKEGQNRKPTRR